MKQITDKATLVALNAADFMDRYFDDNPEGSISKDDFSHLKLKISEDLSEKEEDKEDKEDDEDCGCELCYIG